MTSILGRVWHHISMVPSITQKLTEENGGRSNHDTSTEGGNSSRGHAIDSVTQLKQKEMGTLISRTSVVNNKWKKSTTTSTLPILKLLSATCAQFLTSRHLLVKKCTMEINSSFACILARIHRLKGTLLSSVFGLLEPLSTVQQQQKHRYWTMARGKTQGDGNHWQQALS